MTRKKVHLESDESGHGGDKPWVFFMVDAFFLITEFYILTFKFRSEETVLEQKVPPGGGPGIHIASPREDTQPLRVHVSGSGASVSYTYQGESTTEAGLNATLASLAQSGPDKYVVKVSYDSNTEWGDVMAVFNACKKVKITRCGMVELRERSAD
jgi:biopolymer transport protein ExbD